MRTGSLCEAAWWAGRCRAHARVGAGARIFACRGAVVWTVLLKRSPTRRLPRIGTNDQVGDPPEPADHIVGTERILGTKPATWRERDAAGGGVFGYCDMGIVTMGVGEGRAYR